MRNVLTELLNSSTLKTEGFGGFIRPTAAERAAGRLMRAPDHDAGSGGDSAASGSAGGSDAGASGDASSASGGDAEGAGASSADAGGASDDSTILAAATADSGAGADDGKGEEGKKADEANSESGVPETYELKPFTVGEGDQAKTVEIDTGLLETITPSLKEAGITQAQLEKLAPSVMPAIQERALQQLNDEYAATRSDWAKEAQADKEIGGAKFDETKQLAAKALDHFGAKSEIKVIDGEKVETNPFRKLLNESGLGNHPVMLKMFRNIGASLSESGEFVRNTNEVPVQLSREEKNYPNDVPKATT